MTFALLSTLMMLAAVPGATPSALGSPRFVQIAAVQGVPSDSSSRADFLQGLRDVFAEESLPVLRGEGADTEMLPNRFRLLEGSEATDAWTMQFTVGAPPAVLQVQPRRKKGVAARPRVTTRRASRGVTVVVATRPPQNVDDPAPAIQQVYHMVVPAVATDTTVFFQHAPTGGLVFRWDAAGRAAGLLALEQLHHQSGDLPPARHVSIAPVLKMESEQE